MCQQWLAAGLGELSAAVHAWDLLKEITIIFITSTIIWPQIKQQRGNTAPPINRNWSKDLLSMAPPTRTRASPSVSLSYQEASISLLSFNPLSITGQTE